MNKRGNNEEKKYIGDGSNTINSKNYDLPMAVPNVFQSAKSNHDLETVKSKILKRKQSIEARRMSSLPYDQSYFLNQPGITENSEESMTSFQKTIEEDTLQRLSKRDKSKIEEASVLEHIENEQGFQQVSFDDSEKPSLATFSYKPQSSVPHQAEVIPPKKSEMQTKLLRSTSTLNVAANQEQKDENQHNHSKKEPLQRNTTEESHKETNTEEKEEHQENTNKGPKGQAEQFVIAKFDYNAQKENDLSFNKGDKIRILRKTETGWWIGLCNNKIGYFPYNFVNVE